MKQTITDIDRINDKFFKKIFSNKKNARDFMQKVLPREIKERLDFSSIKIDLTNYISDEFKESFSDLVVKAKLKSVKGKKIPTDIYFIVEHKTEGKVKIFIQILKYMVLIWEQDLHEKRPLRPIIPVVFYHGKDKWGVPGSFVDQFKVDEEVKQFLLNYKYILFDTNPWDFRDENNQELRENVLLFTAMVLMKAAFKKDEAAIREIFQFWNEKGLLENKKMVLFFLAYIIHTQEIDRGKLDKILEENKISGGDFMPTLAQQIKNEGKKDGIKEGEKKEKRETARRMLLDNVSIENVMKYTGLTEKEIKKLMN